MIPKFSVKIEKDQMSAHITVECQDESNPDTITAEMVEDALRNEGVVFGVLERKVEALVEEFNATREAREVREIAIGIPASPAKEGHVEISPKYIANQADLDFARTSTYCHELQSAKIRADRVNPGDIVAEKTLALPSIPGKNVRGEDLVDDNTVRINIEIDETVIPTPDEKGYVAQIAGVVYFIENRLGIVPLNFDGSANLDITGDKMTAILTLHPAMHGGKPVEEKLIKKLLAENHVDHGVKEDVLQSILKSLAKGECPEQPVIIAEGVPPINGANGRIEYLFNTETSLKPKADEKGNVNFRDVSIIQTAVEGKELARVIPPEPGVPGVTVTGEVLPAKDGTEVPLPMGENTKPSESDPAVLVAAIAGNVRLNKKLVEIYEGFIVSGDVNYATGNIKYERSVIVSGDIKSGFNVDCGGDLEVGGSIEDSEITVAGNILCRYGFIGHGNGIIRCRGDVNVGFVKNQSIYSRGNINIAKEAVNPTIYSTKSVTINGNTLSLAGGIVVAKESIILQTAGTESGVKTIIEVGTDYTLIEELEKTELNQQTITANRKKLVESSQKYERIIALKRKLPPQDEALYRQLVATMAKYDAQINALEERMNLIRRKMMEYDNSTIKILRTAYPGTVFKIGKRQHIVRDTIIGPKTVRMVNFEINIT